MTLVCAYVYKERIIAVASEIISRSSRQVEIPHQKTPSRLLNFICILFIYILNGIRA